jgi:hypothetical protein
MGSFSLLHWLIVLVVIGFFTGCVWVVGRLTKWNLGKMALVGAAIGLVISDLALAPAQLAGEILGGAVFFVLIMLLGAGIRNLYRRLRKRPAASS